MANGLPNTFVPGRNIVFLTAAAALGYRRGIADLVGGMCETDFSGYPDCRDETIHATARALSLGLAQEVHIHTPLMWIDKAATWRWRKSWAVKRWSTWSWKKPSPAMKAIAATGMIGAMAAANVQPANLRAARLCQIPGAPMRGRLHDLQRQGNLLHAAGRRRPYRPRRRVPAFRRLQSVERDRRRIAARRFANSATRILSAPTDRAAGNSPMRRRWPARCLPHGRPGARQALCGVHRRRTPAATGRAP